jgi:chromosome segregation ATPase
MTEELNNHNKRYAELKEKYDGTSIELRQTEERLREAEHNHTDLDNRYNKTCDDLRGEVNGLKDEGERLRQQTEVLIRDNKSLDDNLVHLTSNKKTLEADLDNLQKKHEFTVNDMNATVQRLENDNYNLLKTKEDLEHKLANKQAEIRNVQYELKHHRDETNKREIQLQDAISKNETELYKDKEMYKNLNNHHTALKKQLEQLQRERDDNEVLIRQMRDKEYALQEKLKNVQEDLSRSDGTNIKTELRNHVENRRRHLDEVKSILNNLSANLQKVNANEE